MNRLKHQKEKRSMEHFAGLEVSVEEASVCIVDDTGRIVRELKVASEPEALLPKLAKFANAVVSIPLVQKICQVTSPLPPREPADRTSSGKLDATSPSPNSKASPRIKYSPLRRHWECPGGSVQFFT